MKELILPEHPDTVFLIEGCPTGAAFQDYFKKWAGGHGIRLGDRDLYAPGDPRPEPIRFGSFIPCSNPSVMRFTDSTGAEHHVSNNQFCPGLLYEPHLKWRRVDAPADAVEYVSIDRKTLRDWFDAWHGGRPISFAAEGGDKTPLVCFDQWAGNFDKGVVFYDDFGNRREVFFDQVIVGPHLRWRAW